MSTTFNRNPFVRWLPWFKYLVAVIILGSIVWYFQMRPIDASVHLVDRGAVVQSVMGTGTLEARIRTTISPKVAGRIAEVFVDQGTVVKAGQVLVRLDDEDLIQQVRIATAGVRSAEATLGRFRAELSQANTIFSKNEAEWNRYQKLTVDSAVSRSEMDQALENYELAKSGLARAEANLLEAEQQVALNRETQKFQEARLAESKIMAPFDGLIIERVRDPGAIVVPGSPVLQLISLEELWVSAWVDESEMARLKDGQAARIVFRSQPDNTFEGTVARLGKQADRESREFTVDVRVMQLPETWAIGQRAEVFIEVDRRSDCLRVPVSFLVQGKKGTGVFVFQNGRAQWRDVVTGISGRDEVEIVDGLNSGDRILKPFDSVMTLSNGKRVSLP